MQVQADASTSPLVSRRRTRAVAGYVNFPFDREGLRSTGEGGMFVKLVVIDDREYDQSDWNICCGAAVYDTLVDNLVGDDQEAPPRLSLDASLDGPELLAAMDEHESAYRRWKGRHFPSVYDETVTDAGEKYRSRPYVASLLLGITGWSGFDEKREEYWHCTVEDLSESGRALYASLQALYPECSFHLLTFLDT